MKRLDLKIGFDCNNRCRFCAQGRNRGVVARRVPAAVSRILGEARDAGAEAVVFTGGEPTLHPWLPRALEAAWKMGYSSLQVQTNGRRLAYPEYCRELRDAGMNQAAISLHGSAPELHDSLTGAPGSFAQTVKGILNCKRLGLRVACNSVVNAHNYRDLPALAALLLKLGADQYQLAFVHIVGSAAEDPLRLVPRKSDVVPFVKKALDAGIRAGVPCYTEAIPSCLMRGYEERAAESTIPDGPVSEGKLYVENFGDWRRNEGKVKREECGACRWSASCEGPWKEYPALYGWDEFVPVPRGKYEGRKKRK